MPLSASIPRRPSEARPASVRARARRAFTILELMLALSLASIVVASAMGVLWMVVDLDRRLDERFDEQVELASTQAIIRRTMNSLVASPPVKQAPGRPKTSGADDPASGAAGARTQERDDKDKEGEEEEEDPLKAHAEQAGASPEMIAELFDKRFMGRPNFELYFDTESSQFATPRLEVVVMESPVPPASSPWTDSGEAAPSSGELAGFLPVRGAFEVVPQIEPLGFALRWRPLLPAGTPTVLLTNLERVEWWVLPTKDEGAEWIQVQASHIQETYPVAVRLAIWTTRGTHADWLFETGVTTPGVSTGALP